MNWLKLVLKQENKTPATHLLQVTTVNIHMYFMHLTYGSSLPEKTKANTTHPTSGVGIWDRKLNQNHFCN
jgi:hypothetical protein